CSGVDTKSQRGLRDAVRRGGVAPLPPALDHFCPCSTRAHAASGQRQERRAAHGRCWMHAPQPGSCFPATTPEALATALFRLTTTTPRRAEPRRTSDDGSGVGTGGSVLPVVRPASVNGVS